MGNEKRDPLGVDFEYSDEVAAKYVGPRSNAALAQKLRTEKPSEYAKMRAIGVARGWIADEKSLSQQHAERYQKKTLSNFDQEAMAAFSKQECEQFYRAPSQGSQKNAANVPAEQRAILRRAAIAWGVLPDAAPAVIDNSHAGQLRERQEQQKAIELDKRADVHRFPLSEALATRAGLKVGTLITVEDMVNVNWLIRRNEKAAKERASEDAAPKNDPPADADLTSQRRPR